LLDTNVISEFTRVEPAPAVVAWLRNHQQHGLYLSVVTIGEIAQGIERLELSERKSRLQTWLQQTVMGEYGEYILPADTETMLIWGRLTGQRMRAGSKLPVMDALIAATALQHGLILVTRNRGDFAGLGLAMIDPWTSAE
jgi:predicted nucleic acid-binding protein